MVNARAAIARDSMLMAECIGMWDVVHDETWSVVKRHVDVLKYAFDFRVESLIPVIVDVVVRGSEPGRVLK